MCILLYKCPHTNMLQLADHAADTIRVPRFVSKIMTTAPTAIAAWVIFEIFPAHPRPLLSLVQRFKEILVLANFL